MECHVAVQFPGWPPLHYWADSVAAHTFAKAIYAMRLATVLIDKDMRKALQPLPCQRLWR
jgi:hypothetical protein